MESMVNYNNLFQGVYKNRRVLVTGHNGFKGSWMVKWLEFMEANVFGFSLPIHETQNHLSLISSNVNEKLGDIRDAQQLEAFMEQVQPEIVFHLAAQALVRDSYINPVDTYTTNIIGTLNVLEACRKTSSVTAIVVVTSDKCYDNKEWIWGYRENDPMGGFDPYSSSKGCAEILVNSYRNSYFNTKEYGKSHSILLASARAGNVIGGGDWAKDRLIPDMVKAASIDEPVFIRNPLATRPWQHVLEPLSGYLLLGARLLENNVAYADGWNFGPTTDSNLSVDEILKISKMQWNAIAVKYSTNKNDFHEANLLMLDCSKANKIMGWIPVWGIAETIQKTIGWYKSFYTQNKINTNDDIEQFVNNARSKNIVWTR